MRILFVKVLFVLCVVSNFVESLSAASQAEVVVARAPACARADCDSLEAFVNLDNHTVILDGTEYYCVLHTSAQSGYYGDWKSLKMRGYFWALSLLNKESVNREFGQNKAAKRYNYCGMPLFLCEGQQYEGDLLEDMFVDSLNVQINYQINGRKKGTEAKFGPIVFKSPLSPELYVTCYRWLRAWKDAIYKQTGKEFQDPVAYEKMSSIRYNGDRDQFKSAYLKRLNESIKKHLCEKKLDLHVWCKECSSTPGGRSAAILEWDEKSSCFSVHKKNECLCDQVSS